MKDNKIVEIVSEVLAEFDLEDLISSGAPLDEYFPEAAYIVNNIYSEEDLEELVLADIIQQAFLTQFNQLLSIPKCVTVAEGILNKLDM
jgi:hypothetical protein